MHWLQASDTALFYFINRSLSNRFFDWLMPILSGANGVIHGFILAAVLAFVAAVLFGNSRLRLCALMIFLAVALGDGLIVNTIKHAVHRPRPCITLPDAIPRLGCTTSGSMPSAHSANWFAATMIVFIFYGRKRSVIVPVTLMASAVAFSRVYNGVHYPSDVLAGAILGAGYAGAIAVALQWGWQTLGRRLFPIWHARMPSLLNPENHPSANRVPAQRFRDALPVSAPAESDESHWMLLGLIFILLSLIGRWIYIASGTIGLSGDEAYQWLWSKHLAISYYSKPPAIAWIQYAGTHLCGDTDLGVRFFPPVFAAILSWLSLRFMAYEIGARPAFWLLLIVNTVVLLAVGSVLMTIDSPLVLCWTWAVFAGWRAVQPEGRTRDWVITGIAMGLAFLCKYSELYQIVCFAIFFALWRPARWQLRKPGPWLALAIFLVATVPVAVWNAEHHWITLQHLQDRAGLDNQWKPTLKFFGDFWGSQIGLLNPIFFIGAAWAALGFWKRRQNRPLMLYLFCMSWPVILGHALYSFRARILPNWTAPAIPAMFMLMAIYWNDRLRSGARFVKPWMAVGLVIGICSVAVTYETNFIGKITGNPLPGPVDPLRRVRAWQSAALLAEARREELEGNGNPAFIIGGDYAITSECTFYSPPARKAVALRRPIVYCVASDTPENQFYFWPEYNYRGARKGENAIYVEDIGPGKLEKGWFWKWLRHEPANIRPSAPSAPPDTMVNEFESVQDLGIEEIKYRGRVFHRLHLWACYRLK